MATCKQTYIHTYTRVKQCSHASVGLAQARPKYTECMQAKEQKWGRPGNKATSYPPPYMCILTTGL